MDFRKDINNYLLLLKKTIDRLDIAQINTVMNELLAVHARGGMIYIFGNGGSASTASHFVNDFNKGVSENLVKRFRVICLNDNISTLSAVANDIHYNQVFKFQLENYLEAGDLVMGISGSGNSENVVEAIEYANSRGVATVALLGYDGGQLKSRARYSIHVLINDMQKVEDIHLILNHLMMTILKEYMEVNSHDN